MKLNLSFSLIATAATLARATDEEWQRYGCANLPSLPENANGNPMAACFCGLLGDKVRNPSSELSSAELSSQSSTECFEGNAGGFPCENVDLQSHIPLSTFGSPEANDIWGWTDIGSGREFALIGLEDGTGFVEITNPFSPVYLGKLPTQTFSSSWRDVKTFQNHAFIVSEASGHGMQVFDLTQLLSVSGAPVTFSNSAYYSAVGNAHNLVINEDTGYAYIVGGTNGCSGGLHMVDISTPTNPVQAGCYGGDGYTHDAHCVIYNGPDSQYSGKEVCFAANEDTITIVDVSDKANPIQLSRTTYSQEGYTHQGWLSPDHGYFVFGDETDETTFGVNTKTLVFDVQSLTSPSFAASYISYTSAIDHNLYLVGDTIYLASYRAGLRVLKVNNYATADFDEIGFFDIYPNSDSANYNGAWSVYPYFPSGNVVVSGIEQGLFVLLPDHAAGPICNNDGACDAGENCNNCPNDCAAKTNGNPNSQYCCDGYVTPDCGSPECGCGGGSGGEPTPSPPSCGGNNSPCSSGSDCCSGVCKNNGACRGSRRGLRPASVVGDFEKDIIKG